MPVTTLNELFRHSVTEKPRSDLFRYKKDGRWVDVSSEEFETAVIECGQGLVSLGVQPGDRVALLSENRLEWAMADLGILTAGAVVVPIYPTLLPQQIEYILGATNTGLDIIEVIAEIHMVHLCPETLGPLKRHIRAHRSGAVGRIGIAG